ncbi:uncharacterized protein VTP21DRAFT_5362 [Calcarisporiella thermophila]|uniref:uncharacterized protein n=1 Tax=Calcarisporiella thermophila TaxID=911321 RepID=UPI0037425E83
MSKFHNGYSTAETYQPKTPHSKPDALPPSASPRKPHRPRHHGTGDENGAHAHTQPNGTHGEKKKKREERFLRSGKVIEATFSGYTFCLLISIILLHLYNTLALAPNPANMKVFAQFFHFSASVLLTGFLVAHLKSWIYLERFGIIYGLHMILSGWALLFWVYPPPQLSVEVGNLPHWASRGAFLLYLAVLVERRDPLSIVVWEFLTRSDINGTLGYYRSWCMLGASTGWVVVWEGYKRLTFLLYHATEGHMEREALPPVTHILFWGAMSGAFLTAFWSFWHFQFRGVVWRKEYREGIVVWFSDGYHQAAEVRSSYQLLSNGSHFWSSL